MGGGGTAAGWKDSADLLSTIMSFIKSTRLEKLAWIWGCKIGTLPSSYLGMPLGVHYKLKVMLDPLDGRISLRLDSWKTPLLSKGGRLTLIKTTSAAIPNYFLSLFTILTSVANNIETKFRNFLGTDEPNHHINHQVCGRRFVCWLAKVVWILEIQGVIIKRFWKSDLGDLVLIAITYGTGW